MGRNEESAEAFTQAFLLTSGVINELDTFVSTLIEQVHLL